MTELAIPTVSPRPPAYAHADDAGADLCAAETVVLEPGMRATVETATSLAIPDGYAGFVMPRSGLAARHGITVLNAPGTVDAGYRGSIRVTLLNTDRQQSYTVTSGDRIAQLVIMAVVRARFDRVDALESTARGTKGFGSTGYSSRERMGDS